MFAVGKGISAVLGWMLKNPVIVLLFIFTAMFAMVVVSKNAEIRTLRTSIDDPKTGWRKRNEVFQASNATLRANNISLTTSVARQNEALAALQKQGVVADGKFDSLMAAMATSNATIGRKIAAIDAAKPGADKCESAFLLMKGAAK